MANENGFTKEGTKDLIGFIFIRIVLLVVLMTLFYIIYYIGSQKNLTNNETILLTVFIAILSWLISWIISRHYSDINHKKIVEQVREEGIKNLKTYAQKAMEKIITLSDELKKISEYLSDETEKEYDSAEEENGSITEKLKTAVYITNTLKSFSDNALSDWKGVIPEEIKEIEEREERREEKYFRLGEIVDQYRDIVYNIAGNIDEEKITNINSKLNLIIDSIDKTKLRPKLEKRKNLRQAVTNNCPACGENISYKQKPSANSVLPIHCGKCKENLIARWANEDGYLLEKIEIKNETIVCPNPSCAAVNNIKLSSAPFTYTTVNCEKCNDYLKISRMPNKVNVKKIDPQEGDVVDNIEITEALIKTVKDNLPPQPWAHGMSKDLAKKLNLPPETIKEILDILVNKKEVYFQRHGRLYVEKES